MTTDHSIRKRISELKSIMLLVFIMPGFYSGAQQTIPFDTLHWDLKRARVSENLGRQSITGAALLKNQAFGNGILEVDIATDTNVRGYPGIIFRKQEGKGYERIYLRPHRSIFYDDALQYVASFNNADSWQLFNGPGKTSSLDIPPGRWNHLKIIVSGDRADVFWNDDPKPALVIEQLGHGISSGSVELVSTVPGKIFFSDFRITSAQNIKLPAIAIPEPICGAITRWEISSPYLLAKTDFNNYPSKQALAEMTWQAVVADRQGLVDVSKYYTRQSMAGECILAKTILAAEKDTLMRIGFGYSDYTTVYLNKVPLFSGIAAYQSRDISFLGIVGYNDFLFLPLKKGENELALQVGENSGGWGFCFRKEEEVCLHPSVSKAFTLTEGISFPESVVYDPKENVCYVSNYFHEGNESISVITPDGRVKKAWWVTGLTFPTGMFIDGSKLYVVDRSGLNVIDTRKGEITEKIPLPELQMPNDVAMDRDGNIYISDIRGNAVYRYKDGKLEQWLGPEEVEAPNALKAEGDRLLVGTRGKLISVSIPGKDIRVLTLLPQDNTIDGIEPDGRGNYLISDYRGILYRVRPDGEKEVLINTSTPGDNIADFTWIPEKKLILVPAMQTSKIAGYVISD